MNFDLSSEIIIRLINKRGVSTHQICEAIFEPVIKFQNYQENQLLQAVKEQYEHERQPLDQKAIQEIVEDISKKVEQKLKVFVPNYVSKSIDTVLDAINGKQIKSKKKSNLLLSLLLDLKREYQ